MKLFLNTFCKASLPFAAAFSSLSFSSMSGSNYILFSCNELLRGRCEETFKNCYLQSADVDIVTSGDSCLVQLFNYPNFPRYIAGIS